MNFGLGLGLILCYEISHEKWDIRLGTCNIMSLYTAGSLIAADMKIVRCNLNIACMQEVTWDKGSTVRARYYNFSMKKETKIISCEQDIFAPQNSIISLKSRDSLRLYNYSS